MDGQTDVTQMECASCPCLRLFITVTVAKNTTINNATRSLDLYTTVKHLEVKATEMSNIK